MAHCTKRIPISVKQHVYPMTNGPSSKVSDVEDDRAWIDVIFEIKD